MTRTTLIASGLVLAAIPLAGCDEPPKNADSFSSRALKPGERGMAYIGGYDVGPLEAEQARIVKARGCWPDGVNPRSYLCPDGKGGTTGLHFFWGSLSDKDEAKP